MKNNLIAIFVLLSLLGCESNQNKTNVFNNESQNIALFISDFHISENDGSVTRNPVNTTNYTKSGKGANEYWVHNKVNDFLNKLDSIVAAEGKIQYLILMGDIFDLAVHENSQVFNLSRAFFKDCISKYFNEAVYIPGNHDHHMWEQLQYDEFIRQNIMLTGTAEVKPYASCQYLDLDNNQIKMVGNYDSLSSINFISYLISDKDFPVHISYPNFYITSKEAGICVTHGHLLQPGWNKPDTFIVPGFRELLVDTNYFKNIEMKNAPFTEFSNYSIADNYKGKADSITDGLLNRLASKLSNKFPTFFTLDTLPKEYNKKVLIKDSTITEEYFNQVDKELKSINSNFDILLYGHTHVPSYRDTLRDILIYNTGGWVHIKDANKFSNKGTKPMPNPLLLTGSGELKKVLFNE